MKDIRKELEQREYDILSPYACKSAESKGWVKEEKRKEGDYRTIFAHDRDRIIHSHAFRREKDKTQVFILPKNDHIMNRMTHTLEVAQVGKTMATALALNETLTEAIALGHDTCHTCFGHAGESALNNISKQYGLGGYNHAKEAYRRLVEISGLNLSVETLDGIEKHSGLSDKPSAMTLEGQLIQFADKIAYLTSDFENAISMGIVSSYPEFVREGLGNTKSEIITTLVTSIIKASYGQPQISMKDDTYQVFKQFREFSFKEIYYSEALREQNEKCRIVVSYLFGYFMQHPDKVPDMETGLGETAKAQAVIDYIAGMTDKFAMASFNDVSL